MRFRPVVKAGRIFPRRMLAAKDCDMPLKNRLLVFGLLLPVGLFLVVGCQDSLQQDERYQRSLKLAEKGMRGELGTSRNDVEIYSKVYDWLIQISEKPVPLHLIYVDLNMDSGVLRVFWGGSRPAADAIMLRTGDDREYHLQFHEVTIEHNLELARRGLLYDEIIPLRERSPETFKELKATSGEIVGCLLVEGTEVANAVKVNMLSINGQQASRVR